MLRPRAQPRNYHCPNVAHARTTFVGALPVNSHGVIQEEIDLRGTPNPCAGRGSLLAIGMVWRKGEIAVFRRLRQRIAVDQRILRGQAVGHPMWRRRHTANVGS